MKALKSAVVAAALLASSAASIAGPVTVNAGWYGFCFGGVGSGATAGCQNDGVGTTGNSFTFNLAGPGLLKVTDAFNYGDIFDVFVNSVFAFTTSAATLASGTQSNPDLAYADPAYSKGSLALAAGAYSVDIFARASPSGSGGAYMQVITTAVPTPGTLSLVGLGLLAGAAGLRRRSLQA